MSMGSTDDGLFNNAGDHCPECGAAFDVEWVGFSVVECSVEFCPNCGEPLGGGWEEIDSDMELDGDSDYVEDEDE